MNAWTRVLNDLESTIDQYMAEADRLDQALDDHDSPPDPDGFDATWRETLDRLGERVRQLGDIAERAAASADMADAPIGAAEETTRRWLNQTRSIQARLLRFAPARL